jgi:hypothetical protein
VADVPMVAGEHTTVGCLAEVMKFHQMT